MKINKFKIILKKCLPVLHDAILRVCFETMSSPAQHKRPIIYNMTLLQLGTIFIEVVLVLFLLLIVKMIYPSILPVFLLAEGTWPTFSSQGVSGTSGFQTSSLALCSGHWRT